MYGSELEDFVVRFEGGRGRELAEKRDRKAGMKVERGALDEFVVEAIEGRRCECKRCKTR